MWCRTDLIIHTAHFRTQHTLHWHFKIYIPNASRQYQTLFYRKSRNLVK